MTSEQFYDKMLAVLSDEGIFVTDAMKDKIEAIQGMVADAVEELATGLKTYEAVVRFTIDAEDEGEADHLVLRVLERGTYALLPVDRDCVVWNQGPAQEQEQSLDRTEREMMAAYVEEHRQEKLMQKGTTDDPE